MASIVANTVSQTASITVRGFLLLCKPLLVNLINKQTNKQTCSANKQTNHMKLTEKLLTLHLSF